MKQIIFLSLLLISSISYFTYDNAKKIYNSTDPENKDTSNESSFSLKLPQLIPESILVQSDEVDINVSKEEIVELNQTVEDVNDTKIIQVEETKLVEVNQTKILQEQKEELNIAIQEELDELVKENKITFKRLSSDVTKDSFSTLEKIAQILQGNDVKIEIGGHTDAKGKDDVNKWVSQQRARSVKKELEKLGIKAERIKAVGYGETRPIVPNNKDGYAAENRRVEFKVIEE